MSLSRSQIAALHEVEDVWPEAKVVVIGATALGFYYDMRWRQTADVDLAITVQFDEFPGALPNRPGWKQHPNKEHEFTSPHGVRLDLIPAGKGFGTSGHITWSSGHIMNLAGMDLAFDHAERRTVPDGTVWVAPPQVVTVLKMAAFCDRPADRERDLEDVAHLLEIYVDDVSDRRWDQAIDQEFDLAPAYLLGLDVGQIVRTDVHRELVERFIHHVGNTESPSHAHMLRRGPHRWRHEEDALPRRLAAFSSGVAAGRQLTGERA